jgi:hypothetical protein
MNSPEHETVADIALLRRDEGLSRHLVRGVLS